MWLKYCLITTALFVSIFAQEKSPQSQSAPNNIKNETANAQYALPNGFSQPYPMPFPQFPILPPPAYGFGGFPGFGAHFPQPISLPPIDPNVCTLDATILAVLHGPRIRIPTTPNLVVPSFRPHFLPIGAPRNKRDIKEEQQQEPKNDPEVGIMPPCLPGMTQAQCGNAVRVRCAETAVADLDTCKQCCQLATKFYGVPKESISGVLIDSAQLAAVSPLMVGSNRQKRLARTTVPISGLPPAPASCAVANAPCATRKCMCCGPRLSFPLIHPFASSSAPVFQTSPLPVQPSLAFGSLPASVGYGLPSPMQFGPMQPQFAMPNLAPVPFGPYQPPLPQSSFPTLFPTTGQSNQGPNQEQPPN